MCEIFSKQPPEAYLSQTRSVRLSGHATSIRLEGAYWRILEDLAAKQDVSLGRFLSTLYDEFLEFTHDEKNLSSNFTSLLRCACLNYVALQQDELLLKPSGFAIAECTDA